QHSLYLMTIRRDPRSPPFPYTTLFRSAGRGPPRGGAGSDFKTLSKVRESKTRDYIMVRVRNLVLAIAAASALTSEAAFALGLGEDRKSTRLNSSHVKISYAVFCLKKKK